MNKSPYYILFYVISMLVFGLYCYNRGQINQIAKDTVVAVAASQKEIELKNNEMAVVSKDTAISESKIVKIIYKTRTIVQKIVESQACIGGWSDEYYNQLMEAAKG